MTDLQEGLEFEKNVNFFIRIVKIIFVYDESNKFSDLGKMVRQHGLMFYHFNPPEAAYQRNHRNTCLKLYKW